MAKGRRKQGQRPAHVKAPDHLSKNPPVPGPDPLDGTEKPDERDGPTRYGDWVHKGMAVDF